MALSYPTSTTPSAPLFSHPPQTPLHHNQHHHHHHHHQQFSFPISKPTGTLHRHQHRSLAAALSGSSGVGKLEIGDQVLGDTLDGVEVFGLDGEGVVISDLWRDRRAVVAFARHFGCVLCRKRADYLGAKKEQMDASGVALILIGPGTVEQAKAFSQQTKFEGEIYADPSHASYEAHIHLQGWSEDNRVVHGGLLTRLEVVLRKAHCTKRWLAPGQNSGSWSWEKQYFLHS